MTIRKARLYIKNEYLHHHSDGILSKNRKIRPLFNTIFKKQVKLDFTKRKKGIGITSTSLNVAIRERLANINKIKFEVHQIDGIYYAGGQVSGFDFALIDDLVNLYNFRNLCFGRRRFSDGEKRWADFLKKNPFYKNIIKRHRLPNPPKSEGNDIQIKKASPIILGEIQLGNWGLAYRDFFKVLQANILTDVDLLVYIVADGELQDKLSDGIVNYSDAKAIIQEFHKVIAVPIWLIGLDYREIRKRK